MWGKYICTPVFVFVCAQACTHYGCLPQSISTLCLEQGLSLNLELTYLVRLAVPASPRNPPVILHFPRACIMCDILHFSFTCILGIQTQFLILANMLMTEAFPSPKGSLRNICISVIEPLV